MRIRPLLLAVALLASCASAPHEAGLDPTLFEQTSAAVGFDARGIAFVVFPDEDVPQWVNVEVGTRNLASQLADSHWRVRLIGYACLPNS